MAWELLRVIYSCCMGAYKVIAGYNDLATTHPQIASQWHPTNNGDLTPQQVVAGSGKKYWWLCEKGHEWQTTGDTRSKGSGCPYCSGRLPIPGENDLETLNPALAREWHPTKNGDLTPRGVKLSTNKSVWWLCNAGHDWRARVANRSNGDGCPICSGQKVLAGYNDLATTHPQIASQWHPTNNGDLTPQQVVAGSGKKYWWLCEKGHEWQTRAVHRLRGHGCEYCTGRLPIPGENDLETLNPALAREWHPTKNGDLTPREVTFGSSKRAWWLCEKGHEWISIISHRSKGSGCPTCAGKIAVAGFNDLESLNPELATEWHPTKNGDLTPDGIVVSSNRRAWWLCKEGHEWNAVISSRNYGNGCRQCAKYGFDPGQPAILYFISNSQLRARKIGVTNLGTTRLQTFQKKAWNEIFTVENVNGQLVLEVERAVLHWLRVELGLPPYLTKEAMKQTGGETETFSEDGPTDSEITARIKSEFYSRQSADG